VVGLASGHIGYLVSEEQWDVGGYEAIGTLYGRTTGTRAIEAATALMADVKE